MCHCKWVTAVNFWWPQRSSRCEDRFVDYIKFQHLLAAHGLVQHVQSATHVGRQRHLWRTSNRRSTNAIGSLADHLLAWCYFTQRCVLSVRRRRWRSFDIDAFSLDLSNKVSLLMKLPPSESEVDNWFAIYDHLMRTLLDKHASKTSVHTRRWQAAPWYEEDCQVVWVSVRKLEKRQRRLLTTYSLNEWRCHSYVVRSLFQLNLSNSVKYWRGDCRALWTKINHLLRHPTTLTSTLNVDVLANYLMTCSCMLNPRSRTSMICCKSVTVLGKMSWNNWHRPSSCLDLTMITKINDCYSSACQNAAARLISILVIASQQSTSIALASNWVKDSVQIVFADASHPHWPLSVLHQWCYETCCWPC